MFFFPPDFGWVAVDGGQRPTDALNPWMLTKQLPFIDCKIICFSCHFQHNWTLKIEAMCIQPVPLWFYHLHAPGHVWILLFRRPRSSNDTLWWNVCVRTLTTKGHLKGQNKRTTKDQRSFCQWMDESAQALLSSRNEIFSLAPRPQFTGNWPLHRCKPLRWPMVMKKIFFSICFTLRWMHERDEPLPAWHFPPLIPSCWRCFLQGVFADRTCSTTRWTQHFSLWWWQRLRSFGSYITLRLNTREKKMGGTRDRSPLEWSRAIAEPFQRT